MHPKTRQRILRSFLASLLQSELTVPELQELASELETGSLGKELSNLISDAIKSVSGLYGSSRNAEEDNEDFQVALKAIHAKRMPKKMVLELMKVASPMLRDAEVRPLMSKSLTDGVKRYLELASIEERNVFFDILGGKPTDAYLKGINRR